MEFDHTQTERPSLHLTQSLNTKQNTKRGTDFVSLRGGDNTSLSVANTCLRW